MQTPIISVIIPTYNRAHLLKRAVLSVLRQQLDGVEIIISDNCSTDNTSQVISDLQHNSPIPIIYSKNDRNLGMVGNWNHALSKLASGRYAIILSDDDYLLDSTYLQKAIEVINKHNPGLVFSRCAIVDSDSEAILENRSAGQMRVQFEEIVEPIQIIRSWGRYGAGVGFGFSIMLQTAIFDRHFVLAELGGFSQDIISVDYKTWWDLMGLGRTIAFVDVIGAAYAFHGNNETSRNPPSLQKWIENFDCFISTRLANGDLLPKSVVKTELRRIMYDCFLGWPGNIITIYNLIPVASEIFRSDKRLQVPFLMAMFRPISIVKIILSADKRLYSKVRMLKFRISSRGQ